MNKSLKNRMICYLFFSFLFIVFMMQLVQTDKPYSVSERRPLQLVPNLSFQELSTGTFMEDFEVYALDQFPLRDCFRTMKSVVEKYIFLKKDNNGIYSCEEHLSKVVYPLNEIMLQHASNCFTDIYHSYLRENDLVPYLMIIPDKNYYLKDKGYHLNLSYDRLFEYMQNHNSHMQFLDIRNKLCLDDFYYTDTHWKQEKLIDLSQFMVKEMNPGFVPNAIEYQCHTLSEPFYGVYYGQAALPHEPDKIRYLTSDSLDKCMVTCFDGIEERVISLYHLEKSNRRDPYDIFLSGPMPMITIENPESQTNNTLILFRDSFGSSIAPLMVPYYQKVIMLDVRYMHSELIGDFISFDQLHKDTTDVLFLYSTLILNDSMSLQ